MDNVSKLYEELISFSDLYDSASFEAKKMIVNFENGVKSKVGGCIGTAYKSLKTVQAKQCSPPKTGFSKKKSTILPTKYSAFFGGEYRDRTGDLLHAMQALSQLS